MNSFYYTAIQSIHTLISVPMHGFIFWSFDEYSHVVWTEPSIIFRGSLFFPEGRGDVLLQDDRLSPNYMTLRRWRLNSPLSRLWRRCSFVVLWALLSKPEHLLPERCELMWEILYRSVGLRISCASMSSVPYRGYTEVQLHYVSSSWLPSVW